MEHEDSYSFDSRVDMHTPLLPTGLTSEQVMGECAFFSCELDFALAHTDDLGKEILEAMGYNSAFQDEMERVKRGERLVFVDSWANSMTRNQSGSPYGFHLDGAKKDPQTKKADLKTLDKNNGRMFLCLVGDDKGVSSTDFIHDRLHVPRSAIGRVNPWADLHQFTRKHLTRTTRRPLPYGQIATYSGQTIHSASRTNLREGAKRHTRRLTRVSFLDSNSGITPLNELRDPDWMQARDVDPKWVY